MISARLLDGTEVAVRLTYSADQLEVAAGSHSVTVDRVRFDNGETDDHLTLGRAAAELAARGVELIACASCGRFQFSGMSRQMSGGRVGYCHLAGFRRLEATVAIHWRCGEHRRLEGWNTSAPWTLEAIGERRAGAARDGRSAAFAGAIFGMAIGDDTQMALAVAEALIEAGDRDLDELMEAMAARFVAWSVSDDNNRAPGSTCMTACERLAAGASWETAGVVESKGAGAPMRAVPIGLRYWRDRDRLLEVARASSRITHGHPSAVESTAAVALMVALALDKKTPAAIHAAIKLECGARAPELAARLDQVPDLLDAPATVALSATGLGEGWVAEEAVAMALWCLWQSPANFEATALAAANSSGDSDTVATIAGGVSGAFNGDGAIRADWRERIENRDVLAATAARLWAARGR